MVALVVLAGFDPVGHVIPLPWLLPLYVLLDGLPGHDNDFLLTVAVYVADIASLYCVACFVTVIVAFFPSLVLALGVIVNVVPLILHVATLLSLVEQLNVPSPCTVIVLVAFVPYVNVPLDGDKLILFNIGLDSEFENIAHGILHSLENLYPLTAVHVCV